MGSSDTFRTIAADAALQPSAASVEAPYYYLHNFETVVRWILSRQRDLLLATEIDILDVFPTLPLQTRALLVRMIMRKGILFRASKLNYDEIGPVGKAVLPLFELGWLEPDSLLDLTQLFALLTKEELVVVFQEHLPIKGRKLDWLAALTPLFPATQRFSEWYGDSVDSC